jgi:hypothetical protein
MTSTVIHHYNVEIGICKLNKDIMTKYYNDTLMFVFIMVYHLSALWMGHIWVKEQWLVCTDGQLLYIVRPSRIHSQQSNYTMSLWKSWGIKTKPLWRQLNKVVVQRHNVMFSMYSIDFIMINRIRIKYTYDTAFAMGHTCTCNTNYCEYSGTGHC